MKFFRSISRLIFPAILFLLFIGCTESESNENDKIFPKSDNFGDYWYQGKAELNRFDLEQVRYGEIRKGDAVLIFVTEDFLKTDQVKFEFGDHKSDAQSVLKLNFNRRYFTGVYPYSLMTSTFLPIRSHESHALKISFTAQEWCGHTFTQLNNRNKKFQIQHNSYFQAEGDRRYELEQTLLEDEVWTMIRVNPDLLPEGEHVVIPSMQYSRLFHKDFQAFNASIKKSEIRMPDLSDTPLNRYDINYHDLPRGLSIIFKKEFPFEILAWEESYQSADEKGKDNKLVTKAVRTNKMMLDYWSKNSVADSVYRIELGLKQ